MTTQFNADANFYPKSKSSVNILSCRFEKRLTLNERVCDPD
jgi:hypothetical protein